MKAVLSIGSLLVAANLLAATLYVSPNGNDNNSGGSWNTPVKTIGKAVSLAVEGDTVLVTNGTYVLTSQISVAKNLVTVKSVNGASSTIVDGGYPVNTNRCFWISGSNAIVEGFTVQNGHIDVAPNSGKYVQEAWGGCANGGGVRIEYAGVIRNCIIMNNYSGYSGGGVYYHHMFGYYDAGGIWNCTIVNNTAANQGGGIQAYDIPGGTICNCIIYYNTASSNSNYGFPYVNPYKACCTIPATGNKTANNLYVDPQFVASGNYRLSPSSPCRDLGINKTWMANSVDMDGFARIINGIVDIGAYEFNSLRYSISILSQPSSLEVTDGSSASFYVSALSLDPLTYQWQKNGINIANINASMFDIANVSLNDGGSYDCIIMNPFIAVTSSVAALNVYDPPVILQDPADQIVDPAVKVSFSVVANGTDPLVYQWQKNDVDITGENNPVLVINSVTENNAGNYCCNVSNHVGKAKSKKAMLVLNNPVPPPTPPPPTPPPVPPTPPPTPTNYPTPVPVYGQVIASDGIYGDRIRVTWGAVPNANKYQIWRNTENSFSHAKMIDVVDGLQYDDFLTKHNNDNHNCACDDPILYYYWVRAIGVPGQGTVLCGPDSGFERTVFSSYCGHADFNGDGINEYYVYYPPSGKLVTIYASSNGSSNPSITIGDLQCANAFPMVSNYNGDNKIDFGIYNPETYKWYILSGNSTNTIVNEYDFGWNDTCPYVFDYNNDGVNDLILQDITTGKWYVKDVHGNVLGWGLDSE